MTLTQMRYFYEVCKWSSITKAAASLHISQPTVSIAMADLEKESGLNLFRREGKKLSLTEDGSLLLSKITPILANLQQLDRDIKDMAQNKKPHSSRSPSANRCTAAADPFSRFQKAVS